MTQDVKDNIHIHIHRICILGIIFIFVFVHQKNHSLHSVTSRPVQERGKRTKLTQKYEGKVCHC